MLTIIRKLFDRYISVLLIAATALAIIFPNVANYVRPEITLLLIGMLFCGFLKIDFSVFKDEIIHWKYQLYLVFLSLFLIPVVNYYLVRITSPLIHLPTDFSLGVLLVYCTPAAAATPTLCILVKGNLERAVLNVLATSLLAPITIPFLCYIILGRVHSLPLLALAKYIAIIIIIPLIAALLFRRFLPKVKQKIMPAINPISALLLVIFTFGASELLHNLVNHDLFLSIHALLISIFFFIFTFALGWFLAAKKQAEDKITTSMVISWTNIGLAMVIANQFFSSGHHLLMLYLVISLATWNIATALAKPVLGLIIKH